MLEIYNTLRRKKEPLTGQSIKFFVCGPTVYDYAHIGHARTYIFFDFFAKYLRSLGHKVNYLQNITDVDDKIIKRAAEENKKPEEVAEFYTKAYLEDMKALGVDAVSEYAPATKFIPQIIAQVERLIDKRCAYKIDGDGWYFDISTFPDYGKLSGRTATQAEDAVSRIDEAVGKKNKGDFCLWKFSKPGEPVWKSKTLGDGRPGWHIEDTAITEHFFGPQYDIHGGGVDLKFPHHEAEIAQQESASGKKPFVKIWMHTGTLLVDGKKMSKSLGNFITIRDFLKKYPPEVLRLMVFSHHYRSPVDYSEQAAADTLKTWMGITKFLGRLDFAIEKKRGEKIKTQFPEEHTFAWPGRAKSALEDDLNTQSLLSVLSSSISSTDNHMWAMHYEALRKTRNFITEHLSAMGLVPKIHDEIPEKIKKLADEREQFRANQQFVQSDGLRKKINDLGYEIEDTPRGPFLWPKNPN